MQTQIFPRSIAVRIVLFVAMSVAGFYPARTAHADLDPNGVGPFRTQTVALAAGWNAVNLNVEPLDSNPSALFAGTPIEIVAAYYRPAGSMEFVESPTDLISKRENWSVWYAPHREDTLLSNLYAIQAHQSYLIYVEEAYTWTLEGAPTLGTPRWHPNAYSLVGFQIEPSEQPTIASFFAGAEAHADYKIYRMVNGRWSLITDPASTLLQSGVAYWAYSEGASDFAGPLEIELATGSSGGLIFTENSTTRRVVIRNVSPYPQNLTFELTAGNAGLLPMAYEMTVVNGESSSIEKVSMPLPESFELGPVEAGQAFALDLEVNQSLVDQPLLSALLTIHSDAGVRRELPIVSIRRDLIEP